MKRSFLKKIALCLATMTASPFIYALAIKSAPQITAFAQDVAQLSAGMTLGSTPVQSDSPYRITFSDEGMLSYGSPYELSENEDAPVQSEESVPPEETVGDAGPQPYPESLENHSGDIITTNYGKQTGTQFINLVGGGQVRNTTSVPNEKLSAESRLLPEFRIDDSDEPQVLIMHTHTTESYEPYSRDFYDDSFISRTTDEEKNVVSVGEKIATELEKAGIGVIHDRTIHDYPSYNGSYDRSRVTVEKILSQYPSIKVVLDIHRDAIEYDDGTRVAPVAVIDGKEAAQVMIISGCDSGNMNYPDYMKNFRFSCLLQKQLEEDYPDLARPILFTYKKYNQNLTTGSILIEMGGHANSIEQAQYAGELVGKSLATALGKIKEEE